jgi:hypothetical protein
MLSAIFAGVVDDPYQSFAFFSDPDGNGWTLQGVPARP